MGNVWGIVSIILAIIGFFFAGIILGILAIIFGVIGLSKDDKKVYAKIGIILGIIVLIIGIIVLIIFAAWIIGA